MVHKIKEILFEIIYIFLNNYLNRFPIWFIRKLFYQLFGMKIGKNSRILMNSIIVNPWKIKIGDNTIINEYCFLDGRGKLNIGSNVSVAIYSKIITASHDINSNNFAYIEEEVIIEDNVAIFADSIILPGTIIKSGNVIAAGSVVKKGTYSDVGIYAGNPAKYIKERNITNYTITPWKPWFR